MSFQQPSPLSHPKRLQQPQGLGSCQFPVQAAFHPTMRNSGPKFYPQRLQEPQQDRGAAVKVLAHLPERKPLPLPRPLRYSVRVQALDVHPHPGGYQETRRGGSLLLRQPRKTRPAGEESPDGRHQRGDVRRGVLRRHGSWSRVPRRGDAPGPSGSPGARSRPLSSPPLPDHGHPGEPSPIGRGEDEEPSEDAPPNRMGHTGDTDGLSASGGPDGGTKWKKNREW